MAQHIATANLVYGTAWKKHRTASLVYAAIRCGFRAIDSAAHPEHYDEAAVGDGLRRAVVEGIIQTKFTPPNRHDANWADALESLQEEVHKSVTSSLQNFAVSGQEPYIDAILLHTPMRTLQQTLVVWHELEKYVPHKVRRLGICNTSLDVVCRLHECVRVNPSVVQNPFHQGQSFDVQLRRYCRDNDLLYQSFWTLTANTELARSPVVARVADLAGVQLVPAYYSLVMGLGGIAVLDGTSCEAHMMIDLEHVETVRRWALGQGAVDWMKALDDFKAMIGEVPGAMR
ncbi:hypothetical protein CDD80_3902 [Ophiocordyceps camponoti-rufipedis]|uniref:NADP-dependent oxidoreductase domain-containing protein n=1 Tax=Ophiocordyceps camponoti-rufipedis TaxID=2004952 RepID=A0A2C5XI74_9HYPO|nr:hypothetical protein CDD80_3902 [Ophiocordyceps camponoti-rufipedis]